MIPHCFHFHFHFSASILAFSVPRWRYSSICDLLFLPPGPGAIILDTFPCGSWRYGLRLSEMQEEKVTKEEGGDNPRHRPRACARLLP